MYLSHFIHTGICCTEAEKNNVLPVLIILDNMCVISHSTIAPTLHTYIRPLELFTYEEALTSAWERPMLHPTNMPILSYLGMYATGFKNLHSRAEGWGLSRVTLTNADHTNADVVSMSNWKNFSFESMYPVQTMVKKNIHLTKSIALVCEECAQLVPLKSLV